MGKAVQHFCIFAELLDSQTVIFLIQEKSCLLSVPHIYQIFHTILNDLNIGIKLFRKEALHPLHAFIQPYLGITSLIDTTDPYAILQKLFL